jgi:hypothetical protein
LPFIVSSLIAPVAVPLMMTLALAPIVQRTVTFREHIAAGFFVMYAPLATIAYTSQYALLPHLLDEGRVDTAANWYFGSRTSIPWFLDVLAYTFFGMGAIVLAFRFLHEGGSLRFGAWLLIAAGVACILTLVAQALDNEVLMPANLVGAALTVVVAVIVLVHGRRLIASASQRP